MSARCLRLLPRNRSRSSAWMGFERTRVEVAMAAADGDLKVAVEIIMSQQVRTYVHTAVILVLIPVILTLIFKPLSVKLEFKWLA
ncbi:hypothetical protein V6N12_050552 [Hibiscus sabdariffa]|uniref:UBA domain-containing protein n=1 Tax=Hibiscus sabdariffa TaxID=183260 RepID=A0ABR2GDM0_9ROSI